MSKSFNIMLCLLVLVVFAAGCNRVELPQEGAQGEYVHLHLSSADDATRAIWSDQGSGNLIFGWEGNGLDKVVLAVSDGTSPVLSWDSQTVASGSESMTYSELEITPREDTHHADFETVRYYSRSDLNSALHCCAVAGQVGISETDVNHRFLMEMPSSFTQTGSQDPAFLRDYMYMYATAPYKANGTSLQFDHIPAAIRFIITNNGDESVTLQDVSVTLTDGVLSTQDTGVAAKSSDVTFDWATGVAALSYSSDVHSKVQTMLGNTTLTAKDKYTAYALVLPLASDAAFKGKSLDFKITCNGVEQEVLQVSAEKLASVNGSEIYNWVGGRSYTIRVTLGEDMEVSGRLLDENDIEVSNGYGSYILKYVGADGEPLADYAEICSLSVEEIGYYEDFIDVNVAPAAAEAIGIYDQEGIRVGTISIDGMKPEYGDPLYSFGLLSDVHCQENQHYECKEDFQNALTFFAEKGMDFNCICGDITQRDNKDLTTFETELGIYKQIVEGYAASVPTYVTTGNHDVMEELELNIWKQYTGCERVFEFNKGTDHFLFLGMSYWEENRAFPYRDEDIEWLAAKLEAYKNERTFIFTHLFFPQRAGNMNEVYPEGNRLGGIQLMWLESLCVNYPNTIWFSGHSHWEWSCQEFQDKANVYRDLDIDGKPSSGWTVHVPSCAFPNVSPDGLTRDGEPKESQGAVVHIYADHIDIQGLDLKERKYLPIATYRLSTDLQDVTVEEDGVDLLLKADDFAYNKGSDKGEMSIVDVEDMPGYIDVVFSAPSQGWYMTNDTFVPGTEQTVSIRVIDLQVFEKVNDQWVSYEGVPEKVGFYSGAYELVSTDKPYVNAASGVQFQTSSSCSGPWPMKLRMKVMALFQPK